jgi:hypothetical protein
MLGLGKGHDHGEWYANWREHPGKGTTGLGSFKHTLTPLQQNHEVYEPIEAYSEQWYHDRKGDNHHPIEGTRVRNDLPPLYLQWRDDYKRRFC